MLMHSFLFFHFSSKLYTWDMYCELVGLVFMTYLPFVLFTHTKINFTLIS
jgi:hypothetical protein